MPVIVKADLGDQVFPWEKSEGAGTLGVSLRSFVLNKDGLALGDPTVTIDISIPESMMVEEDKKIGAMVAGKGVYIGVWSPKFLNGEHLGKLFDLYAAPYDLGLDAKKRGQKLLLMFNDAVKAVAQIQSLCGHNGNYYQTKEVLLEALVQEKYKGEWFIPPLDILKHMRSIMDRGALSNTFTLGVEHHNSGWYWSSTVDNNHDLFMRVFEFQKGKGCLFLADLDNLLMSTRPVRAEPRLIP